MSISQHFKNKTGTKASSIALSMKVEFTTCTTIGTKKATRTMSLNSIGVTQKRDSARVIKRLMSI